MTESNNGTGNWVDQVKLELGLAIDVDSEMILDIARDAAHAVERPAAPITTFLLGYAIGLGADADQSAKKIEALAKNWRST